MQIVILIFNDLLIFIHVRIGQHPLSSCQKKHKEALQLPATPLRLIPSCKRDGRFEEVQCLPVSSECWCVDKSGKEIKGTRTTGYLRCPSSGLEFSYIFCRRCLLFRWTTEPLDLMYIKAKTLTDFNLSRIGQIYPGLNAN